jgi:hypothetical protein
MSILRALTTGPGAAAVAAGAPHFEDKRRFKMTTMFKGQVRVYNRDVQRAGKSNDHDVQRAGKSVHRLYAQNI